MSSQLLISITSLLIIFLVITSNLLNILILRRATVKSLNCALYLLVLSINQQPLLRIYVLILYTILLLLASWNTYLSSWLCVRLRRSSGFRTFRYLAFLLKITLLIHFTIGGGYQCVSDLDNLFNNILRSAQAIVYIFITLKVFRKNQNITIHSMGAL